MLIKLHDIIAVFGALSTLLLAACTSDTPSFDSDGGDITVTISARSEDSGDEDKTLQADMKLQEGLVLIYDKDGIFEGAEKIDPSKMQASLRITPGIKRIVALANPPKNLLALIAEYCHEPVLDEFNNVKIYKGDTVWRNVKPVHNVYAELVKTLSLTADFLKSVQSSRNMMLLYDDTVEIETEDKKTAYVEIEFTTPVARVDLHARCLPSEKSRVVDAAIRVSHVSPWLNWDYTRPSVEGSKEALFTGISDLMTEVVKEDELFGDWVTANVNEAKPLATLYTYHTDTKVDLEIGLRFKGSADYDWYLLDMTELMKPETFSGLEAGHLYQVFITVYPDKVGQLVVQPWIPKDLEFTIGG